MEPEWEYEWEFVEESGRPRGAVKRTGFHMTDYEAERWWAYGRQGTRRLDETKRDRVAHEEEMQNQRWRGLEPWNHGGLPYDSSGRLKKGPREG
ncbi:hypothetical protein [Paraburkholderia sacchari]|uniref:hypothetical protein n=1 Tax=Paraburkholderia sacchari TaxID=159450 RepID=UPI001BCF9B71|nr:hypothetical protein [Paraburkholderia sacchari]